VRARALPVKSLQTARDLRVGHARGRVYLNPSAPGTCSASPARAVLPQKSTFFTPKLPSGLVFRPLDVA
jgi:hypothetical protein